MIRLFLDIETINAEPKSKPLFLETVKEPRKKVDDVQKWKEEEFKRTALDSNWGQILCIGYLKESFTNPSPDKASILTGKEKQILKDFWDLAVDVDLFIGHNILNFDLKYIWRRSVILGIKPSREISFARFRSDQVYDTMQEWNKWEFGEKTSLNLLAKILDLPTSKDKMNGSEVQKFHEDGRDNEIYEYCKKDVELTRKIYYRMNFQDLS